MPDMYVLMGSGRAPTGYCTPSLSDRFTQLYRDHSVAVLGFALRRTSVVEDAVDVVADTFTVAWRRVGDVSDVSSQRPWLIGIARNVLANQHRSARRRDALARRLSENVQRLLPGSPIPGIDHADLHQALAALDPLDQDLVKLTSWEGLTSNEAATVLAMAPGTVRSRLHRARQILKSALSDPPTSPDGRDPVLTRIEAGNDERS